jgi:protease IV
MKKGAPRFKDNNLEYVKRPKHNFGVFILIILLIIFFLAIISLLFPSNKISNQNIAAIKIQGEIFTGDNPGDNNAYSNEISSFINDATNNKKIKAIFFEIDSPGGSAVGSKEIADSIKYARSKGKLTVAYIHELGASGAYWVASSCDYIVASPMSIVGSIGVEGSYLEYSGLLERYNITYQRLVGGKYKDIGTPYKNLTQDEREILQSIINKIYDAFVLEISTNRNISLNKTYELANGLFYLGEDAKNLGLIDNVGTQQDAINYIESREKIKAKIYEYSSENLLTRLYSLQGQIFFWLGRGIGSIFLEKGFSASKLLDIRT